MRPFIQRFYDGVRRNLNDPHTSARVSNVDLLEMFRTAETNLWERLAGVIGPESSIGRAEVTVTLEDDKSFYLLPGNFRKFMRFEHRLGGDRNRVGSFYPSIPAFHPGPGVEILSAERGFQVRPEPTLSANQDWTLVYEKGPVILHYAKSAGVGDRSLQAGTPGVDAGELIRANGYYNASLLHVYQADHGNHQVREIIGFNADPATPTFTLRHPWSPKPEGDVWYEIVGALVEPYDAIYAMDVARLVATSRRNFALRAGLSDDRREMWAGALSFYGDQVTDRQPTRMRPAHPAGQVDPYEN